MRSSTFGLLALVSWSSIGACSGGYPLPPTPCDEYCNATYGDSCPEFYDPAGCVSFCEQSRLAPASCRSELDQVIACYNSHPEVLAAFCSFSEPSYACTDARLALYCCATPDVVGQCQSPIPGPGPTQ